MKHTLPKIGQSFALRSPRPRGVLPVRGDLAHIALAGEVFVPHYAVPVAYRVTAETPLLTAARDDAEHVGELAVSAQFSVLDIAGQWAWGQAGEQGLIGYVALAQLERAE